MFRYLTPPKILLLALTFVYTESVVPAEATIPILSFLFRRLPQPSTQQDYGSSFSETTSDLLTLDPVQKATAPHSSAIPGRTVWDLFLNKIWNIDSLDALHSFFANLVLLVDYPTGAQESLKLHDECSQRARLSRTSPLGIFVRRAHLEFARLQFQDTMTLWESLVVLRSPSFAQWKKRHPLSPFTGLDINLDQLLGSRDMLSSLYAQGSKGVHVVSLENAERLLEHQVNRIQSVGTRLPMNMVLQYRETLAAATWQPNLSFYVLFLESWKLGDYHSSFDYLHRYFDTSMHSRDHAFYQYALLNLAALHADFGAFAEAIVAIRESISAAREQNDQTCLNYSLSWLYHFGKLHSEESDNMQANIIAGREKDALNFLKVKSKEASMWSVFSTSLLGEVRLGLSNGDNPSSILEDLLKTAQVNLIKDSHSTVGSQVALTSNVYGRLGVTAQCWLLEQVFMNTDSSERPAEDQLQSRCRASFLVARKGRIKEALDLLAGVHHETLRTLKSYNFWIACTGILKARKQLYCGNLTAVEVILSMLKTMNDLGQDVSQTVCLLDIELQIRRKDHSRALEMLEQLIERADSGTFDVAQRMKLMILKVQILAEVGIPQKGFSIALRAAVTAYRAKIYPTLWEAIGALCTILNQLDEFESSTRLMSSIMPQLLECEDCDLAARSFSVLADAHVGLAGKRRSQALQCREPLSRGLENLNNAFDRFSSLEDVVGQCEMLAKKATVMHLYGEPVLANDCAAQYLAIQRAAKEQQ